MSSYIKNLRALIFLKKIAIDVLQYHLNMVIYGQTHRISHTYVEIY